MSKSRRKFSATQKVEIVREYLEGGYKKSEICEKYGIVPSLLDRWKKQLFEGALESFSRKRDKEHEQREKKLEALRSRLSHKDGVIAELLEDNLRLKKKMGISER